MNFRWNVFCVERSKRRPTELYSFEIICARAFNEFLNMNSLLNISHTHTQQSTFFFFNFYFSFCFCSLAIDMYLRYLKVLKWCNELIKTHLHFDISSEKRTTCALTWMNWLGATHRTKVIRILRNRRMENWFTRCWMCEWRAQCVHSFGLFMNWRRLISAR